MFLMREGHSRNLRWQTIDYALYVTDLGLHLEATSNVDITLTLPAGSEGIVHA